MKTIKSKIERVEKETKRISRIDELIKTLEGGHSQIYGCATFINHSTVVDSAGVNIDNNIMIQMLAEQKLTIELEIESDVKFLEAIELMVSPKESKTTEPQAPAPMQGLYPIPPYPAPPAIK